MNKQKQADLVLVLITFFWGIANPISDYVMQFWQPMQLNALRFLVALAVSWALMNKDLRGISRTTLRSGVFVGFLLSLIYLFAMYGIKHSASVTTFSFIVAMPVVINPIINFVFRKVVPQKKFLVSLALSVAGLYLMTMKGGSYRENPWLPLLTCDNKKHRKGE